MSCLKGHSAAPQGTAYNSSAPTALPTLAAVAPAKLGLNVLEDSTRSGFCSTALSDPGSPETRVSIGCGVSTALPITAVSATLATSLQDNVSASNNRTLFNSSLTCCTSSAFVQESSLSKAHSDKHHPPDENAQESLVDATLSSEGHRQLGPSIPFAKPASSGQPVQAPLCTKTVNLCASSILTNLKPSTPDPFVSLTTSPASSLVSGSGLISSTTERPSPLLAAAVPGTNNSTGSSSSCAFMSNRSNDTLNMYHQADRKPDDVVEGACLDAVVATLKVEGPSATQTSTEPSTDKEITWQSARETGQQEQNIMAGPERTAGETGSVETEDGCVCQDQGRPALSQDCNNRPSPSFTPLSTSSHPTSVSQEVSQEHDCFHWRCPHCGTSNWKEAYSSLVAQKLIDSCKSIEAVIHERFQEDTCICYPNYPRDASITLNDFKPLAMPRHLHNEFLQHLLRLVRPIANEHETRLLNSRVSGLLDASSKVLIPVTIDKTTKNVVQIGYPRCFGDQRATRTKNKVPGVPQVISDAVLAPAMVTCKKTVDSHSNAKLHTEVNTLHNLENCEAVNDSTRQELHRARYSWRRKSTSIRTTSKCAHPDLASISSLEDLGPGCFDGEAYTTIEIVIDYDPPSHFTPVPYRARSSTDALSTSYSRVCARGISSDEGNWSSPFTSTSVSAVPSVLLSSTSSRTLAFATCNEYKSPHYLKPGGLNVTSESLASLIVETFGHTPPQGRRQKVILTSRRTTTPGRAGRTGRTFHISAGRYARAGRRAFMEDRTVFILDLHKQCGYPPLPGGEKALFFAVYDGHGGSDTADYVAQHLHLEFVSSEEYQKGDILAAFCTAFEKIESQIAQKYRSLASLRRRRAVLGRVLGYRRFSPVRRQRVLTEEELEEQEEIIQQGIADGRLSVNSDTDSSEDFTQNKLDRLTKRIEGMKASVDELEETIMELGYNKTRAVEDWKIEPGLWSGCTALTVFIQNAVLYLANLGDSRCVISRGGRVACLTEDHRLRSSVREAERVKKTPGTFSCDGYLSGQLGVSRAFGDVDRVSGKKLLGLSSTPDLLRLELRDDDDFIIIGCDGLFDTLTVTQAADIVRKSLAASNDPKEASRNLVDAAFDNFSHDNLSVIVISLNSPGTKNFTSPSPCPFSPCTGFCHRTPMKTSTSRLSPAASAPLLCTAPSETGVLKKDNSDSLPLSKPPVVKQPSPLPETPQPTSGRHGDDNSIDNARISQQSIQPAGKTIDFPKQMMTVCSFCRRPSESGGTIVNGTASSNISQPSESGATELPDVTPSVDPSDAPLPSPRAPPLRKRVLRSIYVSDGLCGFHMCPPDSVGV